MRRRIGSSKAKLHRIKAKTAVPRVPSNYCGHSSDQSASLGVNTADLTNDQRYACVDVRDFRALLSQWMAKRDDIDGLAIRESAYVPMHITPVCNAKIPRYLIPCFSENVRSLLHLPIPFPKFT